MSRSLKKALIDNGLEIGVITTTKNDEVTSISDDGCILRVDPLYQHDECKLICRKSFPKT
jgi:disease resistance protein RPM1